MGVGGSTTTPKVPTERGGSTAAPSEAREMSPSAREQRVGSKRSHPDELEAGNRGFVPKTFLLPNSTSISH